MKFKKLFAITTALMLTTSLFISCNKRTEEKKSSKLSKLTIIGNPVSGMEKNFNPYREGEWTVAPPYIIGFMYEPLVIFDSYNSNKEIMWLAEDIKRESDNKTITIKVRKAIKWSDGELFNADDVVFSFMYTKGHPEIDYNNEWGTLENVEKLDDYTVKLTLKEPNKFSYINLLNEKWIVPEHIFSKIDNPAEYVLEEPVVTGAFSEVKEFKDLQVALGKNNNYWNAKKLKVDELVLLSVNGSDSTLTLMQEGKIDWFNAWIPNIENTYILGDKNKKYSYGKEIPTRLAFNFNTTNGDNKKAFNSADFRRALSLAVDRDRINEVAYEGLLSKDIPTATGLSTALFGYINKEAQDITASYTKYDLEKAKEILDKAGFVDKNGDGFRENIDGSNISFNIVSPNGWSDWNSGANICAEGLRAIGINATANPLELESFENENLEVIYSSYYKAENIYDFYSKNIVAEKDNGEIPFKLYENNYVNNEINSLIKELPKASDDKAEEIVSKVEKFYAENMINIPILYGGKWFGYNDSRFTGWTLEGMKGPNSSITENDTKILQLLNLKPVQ